MGGLPQLATWTLRMRRSGSAMTQNPFRDGVVRAELATPTETRRGRDFPWEWMIAFVFCTASSVLVSLLAYAPVSYSQTAVFALMSPFLLMALVALGLLVRWAYS